MPRSVWLVEAIGRGPAGKPDYGWAQQYAASHPAAGRPAGAGQSAA